MSEFSNASLNLLPKLGIIQDGRINGATSRESIKNVKYATHLYSSNVLFGLFFFSCCSVGINNSYIAAADVVSANRKYQ